MRDLTRHWGYFALGLLLGKISSAPAHLRAITVYGFMAVCLLLDWVGARHSVQDGDGVRPHVDPDAGAVHILARCYALSEGEGVVGYQLLEHHLTHVVHYLVVVGLPLGGLLELPGDGLGVVP